MGNVFWIGRYTYGFAIVGLDCQKVTSWWGGSILPTSQHVKRLPNHRLELVARNRRTELVSWTVQTNRYHPPTLEDVHMHPSSQMLSFMGTTWLSFLAACEWNTTRQVPPLMRCYKLVWNLILHYLTLLRTTINQAVNPVLNQLRFCEARTRHLCSKLERFGARTFPAGRQLQESLGSLPQGAPGRAAVLGPATGRCWSRWRPESDMDMLAESNKDTLQ